MLSNIAKKATKIYGTENRGRDQLSISTVNNFVTTTPAFNNGTSAGQQVYTGMPSVTSQHQQQTQTQAVSQQQSQPISQSQGNAVHSPITTKSSPTSQNTHNIVSSIVSTANNSNSANQTNISSSTVLSQARNSN